MDVTLPTQFLPFSKVGEIEERFEPTWLIESLWLKSAAGIIGGQPKCCKSWLGLDMAVSVASNTPCLGRFPVTEHGPALVFLAEDSVDDVRKRVASICRSRSLCINAVNLIVITAPTLRLDSEWDQKRLRATIDRVSPKFLLLDPLVRLHRLDENNARDIAGLLGFLREIQRKSGCAVVLTHHANKRVSSRPGQGLRGTSDLHAFGDSNLYLSRNEGDTLDLVIEHRSAKAPAPLRLQLTDSDYSTYLTIVDRDPTEPPSFNVEERILECLSKAPSPVQRDSLRQILRINNQRLGQAVSSLIASGKLLATPAGLRLA